MSTHPGEDPDRPEGFQEGQSGEPPAEQTEPPPPGAPESEPPTAPGYWEQQAAEQARAQEQQGHPEHTAPITPSGATFDPTGPQPTRPYEQGYGPQGYGQQSHGPGQYGQDQHGQPYGQQTPYGQPPYLPSAQPYQQPQGAPGPYSTFAPALPNHPQATTSMVLSLVGLIGAFFFCGLTLVLSPFAWALGRNALKEIEVARGQLGGESTARAGMVMGIIGTALLALGLLLIIGFAVVIALSAAGSSV